MKIIIFIPLLIIISACSSSYDKLSKNILSPTDEFSQHLLDTYKKQATFEAIEMHDWNSAKLYSEKALNATKGKKIKPEKISYWKISEDKIEEINKSYEDLMIIYEEALITDPYNLAIAISSLDCWAEQTEERWQIWDIKKCKEKFLNAMHNIHNQQKNIKKENKNNDSVSIISTNTEENILQIIYFDFDKFNLSNVSKNLIIKFLNKNKNEINKFLIVGHTDSKGTKEYNLRLSIKRAIAVKKILTDFGIEEEKINTIGKGENDLMIKTNEEIAHPANRRAEIRTLN